MSAPEPRENRQKDIPKVHYFSLNFQLLEKKSKTVCRYRKLQSKMIIKASDGWPIEKSLKTDLLFKMTD